MDINLSTLVTGREVSLKDMLDARVKQDCFAPLFSSFSMKFLYYAHILICANINLFSLVPPIFQNPTPL